MTCPICVTSYNKTINACVRCPDATCGYEACKECVRTYLLGTTQDPHCMDCRKAFDPEFITTNLNMSWMKTTYRDHRKKLLVERELVRIPDTMQIVENRKHIRALEKEDEEYKKAISDLNVQLHQMREHRYKIQRDINVMKRGGNVNTEKKQFIMPCPDEGCRGFLSTAYKCGACSKFTCPKCYEVIGLNKTDVEHVCNEDNVKSAELIKKETRPCPSCGERIYKISGCDQMWCPTCKTAFSWKTGAIDTGVIHNPHFYQWQRAGGNAIRNPGDVACGGLPELWSVRSAAVDLFGTLTNRNRQSETYRVMTTLLASMSEAHRELSHIINYIVNRLREDLRNNDPNRDLRVSYILKEVTKEQFSATLVRYDNIRKKNTELLHIWELVQTVAIEHLNEYVGNIRQNITDIRNAIQSDPTLRMAGNNRDTMAATLKTYSDSLIHHFERHDQKYRDEVRRIAEYANSRFAVISATFNCTTPKLGPRLREGTQKAKQSVLKSQGKTRSQQLYPNGEGAV